MKLAIEGTAHLCDDMRSKKMITLTAALLAVSVCLSGYCQTTGDVSNVPQTMHLCTNHCETLMWVKDHYDGKADENGVVISRYTVSSWTPENVTFTGVALKRGLFGVETRAVFRGTIAAGGGSIANPKVDVFANAMPIVKGVAYTLTWDSQPGSANPTSPQTVSTPSIPPSPIGASPTEVKSLPPMLYECDLLPTRKTCSIWKLLPQQFAGHYEPTYEGKWPDSATGGKITIIRFDGTNLEMSRKDETGRPQGQELTATYTGIWNGTKIVDGKMSWSWNGYSAVNSWSLTSIAPSEASTIVPLSVYEHRAGENAEKYGVQNDFIAPLTAYAIQLGAETVVHVEDFRVTPDDVLPAGERRDERTIFHTGGMPSGKKVIAAVFADGTARGDEAWVEAIMEKRNDQLWTYETMARELCSAGTKHQSVNTVADRFRANKSTYVRDLSQNKTAGKYINGGGEQAYEYVLKLLAPELNGGGGDVSRALKLIGEATTKLRADPVKSREGKFYLSESLLPATCQLP